MRGVWDSSSVLALATGQQIQQQQLGRHSSIMEEQQPLPLHSPTTPAWSGITDRIVKEEQTEHQEDKNNDSGVSPDHYTSNSVSPRSSSSTVNCSLSPGSASSPDSNAMQCESFDYNPHSIYKINDMSQRQDNERSAMDDISNSMKSGCESSDVTQDTFQCPVCSFTTPNRIQFTEHITTHYVGNCERPDLSNSLVTGHENENHPEEQQQQEQEQEQQQQRVMNGTMAMDETNRATPPQGERSEQESEEADEPGLRVPRVNSQGKVKKFRCKQCNFVAITKLEFWEHSRGHIKAEKLLTCPKCPFVTEYKHHLEYHLRNHFGSKPFKCDKCSYSCVNKSMLNSHLKSHSNVYQYRCANCSYATKYCHSLKVHLRKYEHQPAMVLNADGSPNPLPIIDVYGTRRGPKQKPSTAPQKGQEENCQLMNNPNMQIPGQQLQQGQPLVLQPQLSPSNRPISMNPMIHALPNGVNPAIMPFPYNQLFPRFPLANNFPIPSEPTEKQLEDLKNLVQYAQAIANEGGNNVDYPPQDLGNNAFLHQASNATHYHQQATSPSSESFDNHAKSISPSANACESDDSMDEKSAPLDLSKPEAVTNTTNNNNSIDNNNKTSSMNHMPEERAAQSYNVGLEKNTNSPKTSGTSRRKGKAVKLDRRVMQEESDNEPEKEIEGSVDSGVVNENNLRESSKRSSPERNLSEAGADSKLTCQYCELSFGDIAMYTVHMGYHGFYDPFTCNMCGHECDDKLSFFLHIARSKHS